MATQGKPPIQDSAVCTPPITPLPHQQNPNKQPLGDVTNIQASSLTPPTSPRQGHSLRKATTGLGLDVIDGRLLPSTVDRNLSSTAVNNLRPPQVSVSTPLECPFDIEILSDQNGREQIYGTGAWSTVLKGISHQNSAANGTFLTPPSSPVADRPQLVAIKRPARQGAIEIIRSEATILHHLAAVENTECYVVPFYGFLSASGSLVLAAIPLSLEDHCRRCAIESRASQTTWNMSDPVLGSTRIWLDLAKRLIEGLAWLHKMAGVVHGDIKPGNILLSPTRDACSNFAFTPLFADFTSGQLLDSDTIAPNTLSAVTREYTAPELLSYAVLSDPKSTATTASDVFSLAVTLLIAATGETTVYSGSVYQRQAMATQGWFVLSNVQNGPQGAKVPRHGIVEQVLERAVLKAGMGRIDAQSWVKLVETKIRGGPEKECVNIDFEKKVSVLESV